MGLRILRVKLEAITGKKFGDKENPLLVSVCSGARASMPGMMDTILNLGLNEDVVEVMAAKSGNPRWAYDCYRRFIQMYSDVVMEVGKKYFKVLIDEMKEEKGVTRMTTQGSAARQRNNHPFLGKLAKTQFALAHNGVLSNDEILRKVENLPQTNIETDSYVAVQLIEKESTLDFNSLKAMAEKVKGTFTFTVLDQKNNLYIIKGNNPLCLYSFPKKGIYIYASTKPILEAALDVIGYLDQPHEEIPIAEGEIVKIDAAGRITRDHFQPPVSRCQHYDFYDYYEDLWGGWEPVEEEPAGYRKYLMEYAIMMGIPQKELDYLHRIGLPDFELEECIYNKQYRRMCLLDTGYYSSEMEDYIYDINDCSKNLPFMQT